MRNPEQKRPLRLILLDGHILYEEARTLQRGIVSQRIANEVPDTLIVLEHAPVITLGQNANETNVLAEPKILKKNQISVHKAERGGDVTYHGPGQLVGYAIFDLHEHKIGVEKFVAGLEEVMILTARALGVKAERRTGYTGVFCGSKKIGAIGVRVTRGVTYHGCALNVEPNLSHFKLINPCGLQDIETTSIAAEKPGPVPSMKQARQSFAEAFCKVYNMSVIQRPR